jgi:S1-C subfamily serine protease
MANALKDLSASLREAVRRASAYTVGVEKEPYSVSAVLIGGDRVLTASHLVGEQGATITMPDGKTAPAKTASRDFVHDLALLRLEGHASTPAPAVASVEVGDLVISVKRDPFDGINASLAMVSAAGTRLRLARSGVLERYFQTDADRLTGSTGGPLADAEGSWAGIQVFNRRMGAEVALPAAFALERARLLEEKGSIRRPHVGVRSQVVPLSAAARAAVSGRQDAALLLVTVEPGSAADRAGLEVGDILVGFAGKPVSDHETLVNLIGDAGCGAEVKVEVVRAGSLRTVSLTVGGA